MHCASSISQCTGAVSLFITCYQSSPELKRVGTQKVSRGMALPALMAFFGKFKNHDALSVLKPEMWKRLFRQPLPLPHLSLLLPPLPLIKNEKTTIDHFLNFYWSVACLLLHYIILRTQKPPYIAITLPTSLKFIVPNYFVFLFF